MSSGRVASVWPSTMPESSWSTSTERLPLCQSSATRPCSPTACAAAFSVSSSCTERPRSAASSVYAAGTDVVTNQLKMSPTPLCPAS